MSAGNTARGAARRSIVPVAILVLWEVSVRAGLLPALILPPPSGLIEPLASLLTDGQTLADTADTTKRLLAGFGLAALFAIPAGILFGQSRRLDEMFRLPMDFARSLPVTALIPAFIVLFGLGELNKVAMVAFVVTVVLTIQVRDAVRAIPVEPLDVARLYDFPRHEVLLVAARLALPGVASGLRVSVNLALVVVIVVEMFVGGGTTTGLGYRIYEAQSVLQFEKMWALIILVGLYGYAVSFLITTATRRIAPWAAGRT